MKIDIRGIPFDNVTKEEALSLIEERLNLRLRTAVFTPNAEIVQSCVEDGKILDTVKSADVILPDGIGVVKASKILGTPLKEKVPGVEIGEALFSRLSGSPHSFYILGGESGVAEEAAVRMNEKYGATFAGHHHGYFEKSGPENDEVVSDINSSGADVLIVCLGFPVQERWIEQNFDRMPGVFTALALGGSVDVYAGKIKRAPKIFIKTGLEWLWRLIKQPSRIGRMMKLPKFYLGMKKYKREQDNKKGQR